MTIISKTKYEASEEEIKKLFSFHKLGNVLDIAALGCGEFNESDTPLRLQYLHSQVLRLRGRRIQTHQRCFQSVPCR